MIAKKSLSLLLVVVTILFFAPSLTAKGSGQGGSSEEKVSGQGKGGSSEEKVSGQGKGGSSEEKGSGQAQGSSEKSMTQDQKKQQTKTQEKKQEQKRTQKREQKRTQKKEQKKTQSKDQKKTGEGQGQAQGKGGEAQGAAGEGQAKGTGGEGKAQGAAAEEGTETKIEGKGKVVKTEDGFMIEFGDKKYEAKNLQEKYQIDGLEVDFTAEILDSEDGSANSIAILDIASDEVTEEIPVASEVQAKDGQIMEEKGSKKQQGKSKLSNDF